MLKKHPLASTAVITLIVGVLIFVAIFVWDWDV